jgi:signal transduction histidine kinase
MIWNWLRRHPLIGDVVLVFVLLVPTIGVATRREHTAAGVALGIVETLPLLVRRYRPFLVLGIVAAAVVAMSAFGVWLLPFQLGVALYTVATTGRSRDARLAGLVAVAAVIVTLPLADRFAFGDAAARVVFLVASWLLGESVGSRRAYVREIEEKAERLERERESETRRAAAEEQARIGRELHDIVAHALSVIIVQAGAAEDVFGVDPRRAREPICAIDAAARSALADLRRALGIVKPETDYEPQPGLARLEQLVQQVRAAGLKVSLSIEGAARSLPASVDLSAYRIVQEALTNTLKHADAEHVRVRVTYANDLRLEIRDNGRGSVNGSRGSGLIGMRERVALLGGTIETGTGSDGTGYRVSVRIPFDQPA